MTSEEPGTGAEVTSEEPGTGAEIAPQEAEPAVVGRQESGLGERIDRDAGGPERRHASQSEGATCRVAQVAPVAGVDRVAPVNRVDRGAPVDRVDRVALVDVGVTRLVVITEGSEVVEVANAADVADVANIADGADVGEMSVVSYSWRVVISSDDDGQKTDNDGHLETQSHSFIRGR